MIVRHVWYLVGLIFLTISGCATTPLPTDTDSSRTAPACPHFSLSDLAGEWEVEENGVVVPLTMDPIGTGTYEGQRGYLQTTSFDGIRWRGTWNQPGKDRDGRFDVRLSANGARAEGQWWYLRIGDEHFGEKAKGGPIRIERTAPVKEGVRLCAP